MMKKFKIAIACPYDLSIPGGVQQIAVGMHERLLTAGFNSTLISVTPQRSVAIGNLKCFGTGLTVPMNRATGTISMPTYKWGSQLKRFFKSKQFDLICLHEPDMPFLNWQILRYSSSLNIGWFHSTAAFDIDNFSYNFLKYPLEWWLKSKLHGYIALSPTVKKTWRGVFDSKGIVLPAGIDKREFSLVPKIDLGPSLKVLFVGRLDKRKGVLYAIRAVNLLSDEINAKLFIVGDGPEMVKAQDLVKTLNIGHKVKFIGRVERRELLSYYLSCDIFCAPSTRGESLGIVLLEAMSAGLPIVAFANPGYKFTLEGYIWENGLVKVGSAKGLAKSILELAENKSLREKIRKWEFDRVEEFSWERVISKFLKYAESLRSFHK